MQSESSVCSMVIGFLLSMGCNLPMAGSLIERCFEVSKGFTVLSVKVRAWRWVKKVSAIAALLRKSRPSAIGLCPWCKQKIYTSFSDHLMRNPKCGPW